jgi:4'-phosphopantetheinyl transferase
MTSLLPAGSSARGDAVIALTSAEIHLWVTPVDELGDGYLTSACHAILSHEEREHRLRFRFDRDRRRYASTRVLVRTLLSRYLPVPPEQWVFSANSYGRPQIDNAQAIDARLSFNISHTHDFIVVGVTHQRELGVDVENVRMRTASLDIAERFFSPQEVAALAALPVSMQQKRFFELWTLKESYIKARGMGLSIPLDQFWFSFDQDGGIALTIAPELQDDARCWHFWQFRPTPDNLVAICAGRVDSQTPCLKVMRIASGTEEKPSIIPPYRAACAP